MRVLVVGTVPPPGGASAAHLLVWPLGISARAIRSPSSRPMCEVPPIATPASKVFASSPSSPSSPGPRRPRAAAAAAPPPRPRHRTPWTPPRPWRPRLRTRPVSDGDAPSRHPDPPRRWRRRTRDEASLAFGGHRRRREQDDRGGSRRCPALPPDASSSTPRRTAPPRQHRRVAERDGAGIREAALSEIRRAAAEELRMRRTRRAS